MHGTALKGDQSMEVAYQIKKLLELQATLVRNYDVLADGGEV